MALPIDEFDDEYFDKHLHNLADLIPGHLVAIARRCIGYHERGARTALAALEAGRTDLAVGILRSLAGDES